jgi:hypothetical protein
MPLTLLIVQVLPEPQADSRAGAEERYSMREMTQ